MFSEIIHGLIWRTQTDNGRNLNSPEETLLPCSLRIGIIPAGQQENPSAVQFSWLSARSEQSDAQYSASVKGSAGSLCRLCVFVSGSTDCICFATVGTNDPVTSALHIIVGESRDLATWRDLLVPAISQFRFIFLRRPLSLLDCVLCAFRGLSANGRVLSAPQQRLPAILCLSAGVWFLWRRAN